MNENIIFTSNTNTKQHSFCGRCRRRDIYYIFPFILRTILYLEVFVIYTVRLRCDFFFLLSWFYPTPTSIFLNSWSSKFLFSLQRQNSILQTSFQFYWQSTILWHVDSVELSLHSLLVLISRENDCMSERTIVPRLRDTGMAFRNRIQISFRCSDRGELTLIWLTPVWDFALVSCKLLPEHSLIVLHTKFWLYVRITCSCFLLSTPALLSSFFM